MSSKHSKDRSLYERMSNIVQVCVLRRNNNLFCNNCEYSGSKCDRYIMNHEGMTPYDFYINKKKN